MVQYRAAYYFNFSALVVLAAGKQAEFQGVLMELKTHGILVRSYKLRTAGFLLYIVFNLSPIPPNIVVLDHDVFGAHRLCL